MTLDCLLLIEEKTRGYFAIEFDDFGVWIDYKDIKAMVPLGFEGKSKIVNIDVPPAIAAAFNRPLVRSSLP